MSRLPASLLGSPTFQPLSTRTTARPNSFGNVLANVLATVPIISANPILGLSPTGTLNLQPGQITYLKINEKHIKADVVNDRIRASGQFSMHITVHDAYIKVDDCSGPVSVRLAATAQMTTSNSDDESNAFGDIVQI
ncbi:MAG: MspA family porin [Mycobacterium sp.]